MGETLPFREEHIPAVASLYLRVMRGRRDVSGRHKPLEDYFREIFLQNPWASADMPSVVHLDGGKVLGFLGVVPRFMTFRGRRIRVATLSQAMVDRESDRGIAAFEMMERIMAGPQELSYADGASEPAYQVWAATGWQAAKLYSFHWVRVLRPAGTARYFAGRAGGALGKLAGMALAAAPPVDLLLSKAGPFRPPATELESRRVGHAELLETMERVGWREPLRPCYEAQSFEWLISQTAAGRRRGELRMAAVLDKAGQACGWYVYYARPGKGAQTVQIGLQDSRRFDGVLRALFRDAWEAGCSFVKGQAIPKYLVPLSEQGCVFRQMNTCALFHTRDRELSDAILRGDAALSWLDGEAWLRFSAETWE